MSDERRISYDWARVECPTCGAGVDERCRTLTTKRTTDAHERRHHAAAVALWPTYNNLT